MEEYKIKPPNPTLTNFKAVHPLLSLYTRFILLFLFSITKVRIDGQARSDNSYKEKAAARGNRFRNQYVRITFFQAKFYSSITRVTPFFSFGTYSIFLCSGRKEMFPAGYCHNQIQPVQVFHNR